MRRRWVYRNGEAIEVTPDWVETPRPGVEVMTGACYDGARAPDGADISSRRKRNEYMRVRNLADADDFKGQWAKQQAEREAYRTGQRRDPALREALARAMHQRRRP